jgi:hypothetical protein
MRQFVALFKQFRSAFSIAKSSDLSITMLLFLRTLFNVTFIKMPTFFCRPENDRINALSNVLRCADLGAPVQYLPSFQHEDLVADVFRQVDGFVTAGRYLSQMAFYTNPIDMLYQAHCALGAVQSVIVEHTTAADRLSELLTMENIFTLFMGSLLTENIALFETAAQLVVSFEPPGRLSPPFQYAHMTVSAALAQLRIFYGQKFPTDQTSQ